MNEKSLKIYNKNEVFDETLKYFNGDELATNVWMNKYCLKDSDDNLYEKSPIDMHNRLSSEFARIEDKYPNPLSKKHIFNLLDHFKKIVPAGSPMSGIGNNFQYTSLSNCFVIGNDKDQDSYGAIMKLDQDTVQLQKRRGGVGLDISFIRPKFSKVNNSALTSTGIVPFMERYSNTTKEVAQDGRRGALMITINVNHPDTEDFVDAKTEKGKVTGANISVKLIKKFMQAVKENKKFIQHYPVDWNIKDDELTTGFFADLDEGRIEENKLYKLKEGYYVKVIDAKKLWNKIIYNAWKSAEPGLLFWDNIINESIPDCYEDEGYKTVATNPCGEVPLCPNDSCRLLSINLLGYVVNPYAKNAYFNFEQFKNDVKDGQRLMDDIVDLELEKINAILNKINNDPETDFIKLYEKNLWESIKDKTKTGRRTGFGVTAVGDMLAAINMRYGTKEANNFITKVFKKFKLNAYESSVNLAKERGAFKIFNAKKEVNNPFIRRINKENPKLYKDMVKYGRRNIALLSIAPTGSVSILTQSTSGIEPVFLPVYTRRRKINPQEKDVKIDFVDDEGIAWTEYVVFHHGFKKWLEMNNFDINKIKNMDIEQINELVKVSPYYKATSKDIDWVSKVKMQGMIQKHIDHSISVTVNLPEETTVDTVKEIYLTGWKSGCKGITIYREGSREGVLISDKQKKEQQKHEIFQETHAPKRPKRLEGDIIRFQNNLEKWIGVVGLLEGRPYEVFTGRLENGLQALPTYVTKCTIVKIIYENKNGERKKRYDIEYFDSNNEKQVIEGLSHTFNPEFWNYAKLISGILRHGMPIKYVKELINSLSFKEDHLNTWKAGVGRIMKRYIKDGEKAKGKCPICGSTNLEYIEGCVTCKSCGYSKCS